MVYNQSLQLPMQFKYQVKKSVEKAT